MKQPLGIPPTYFYLSIILIVVFYFLFPEWNVIMFPHNLVGLVLLVVGIWLIAASYLSFQKYGTTERFEKSKKLVTSGLYSFSRNPMYLGSVIFLFGLAVLFGNAISIFVPVLFFFVIDKIFIPYEEVKAGREFGKKYKNYRKRVRRWV